MPSARGVFAGLVAAGLALVLALGLADRRPLAFTLGVGAATPIALPAGDELCQRGVEVVEAFDRVRFAVGTYRGPAQPLVVRVGVATTRVRASYRDNDDVVARVGRIDAEREVDVCIANGGGRPVAVYGSVDAAAPGSTATLDGRATAHDLDLVFERAPRGVLGELPAMLERAALFDPRLTGAWLYWVLLALIAVGGPVALWRALRAAEGER